MVKRTIILLLLILAGVGLARDRVDLNGAWRFAIDPVGRGETYGWHQSSLNVRDWTEVQVPHCWTVDPRYPYTGTAWYRRSFSLPSGITNQHARILFDGVFYRTKVWLNGQWVGEHEGGYTPFQFDVAPLIRWSGANTLAVQVDNSWSTNTLPGARIGPRPQDQVYPWFEYGGIVRPVTLVLSDSVYVAKSRVIASPDLANGTATIEVATYVVNASDQSEKIRLGMAISLPGEKQPAVSWPSNSELSVEANILPRSTTPVTVCVNLSPAQVKLWDVDHPNLYTLHTHLWRKGGASGTATDEPETMPFGIRKLEARGGQLLLNGEPIRMAGGNRHADHPRYGSIDPRELIEADLRQMKRANMEFCRISHYPVSPLLLDWADRNGLLIIEEGLNWQLTEAQMDSPEVRAKFQSQMQEIIERDWNHPSVIGWSVGNEYPSETPSGLRWTKDMTDFVRKSDRTRLLTFASDRAGLPKVTRPEGESSCYVDLICVNLYKDYAERLDRIHSLWPDKPVMVSEFAARGHVKLSDREYEPYFLKMIEVFRSRPYVVGAAVWTYNDYRSRYPGTDADGYRHYGAVTAERQPKPAYDILAGEFSPAVIRDGHVAMGRADGREIVVSSSIQVRSDFPSYSLRNYAVKCQVLGNAGELLGTRTIALPLLNPGDNYSLNETFKLVASAIPALVRLEVMRPTDFVTTAKVFSILQGGPP